MKRIKDLALLSVNKYEYLVGEKDGDGMTSLQLLACNPSAFVSGSKRTSLKKLFYNCMALTFSFTRIDIGIYRDIYTKICILENINIGSSQ